MRDEPFVPIAAVNRFDDIDQAVSAANALPYALAAFVFCRLSANSAIFAKEIEAGMVSINGFGLAAPETPFGGIKDSGYGSEGGRSEEHTSELQSLMRISYAVFCFKKKTTHRRRRTILYHSSYRCRTDYVYTNI